MLDDLFSMNGKYARFMNWLWNVLCLSILWIVCCIPVVTVGAASTAAYYTAAKVIRRNTGKMTAEFFSSFRSNFSQATILTIIVELFLGLLTSECIYLYSDRSIPLGVLYLFYFLLLAFFACSVYLWACLSRFRMGSFALFKMSAILVFRHFLTTILLLALYAALFVGIYLMPWGILLFPGLMLYGQTFLMEKILLHYTPEAESEEEAQKWYYQ